MAAWLAALAVSLLCALPLQAAQPWQTLANCRLVESRTNDGDSFRVRWNGGEWTVRLYFADTPEADTRFRDRTRAQAEYFGITEGQAVEVGKTAKAFTRDALKGGFSVRTRWQGVFGNKGATRKYGIVSVKGQDLAELLVANGLARIHGMGIGGKTWEEVERLKALEAKAKAAKRGAWGLEQA
ncbi:MAG: thermonuclease family protein [Kiritimatiellia bacterium]